MGAQNNDINRTVDGDIAEGHVRFLVDEAGEQKTNRKMVAKKAPNKATRLEDEAEGHARFLVEEAGEGKTNRKMVAKKAATKATRLEDEAEGHAILRSPDRPAEIRQIGRRAKATIDEASEGHIKF